ncbi:UNVERIFIED_CONTAM: hypothetical protein GTU68_034420, partial [Idotea baltica]|nr:hypothetical protein [Idotea baltica]
GGVLFSLEEGASFWNQSLTWRVFFSALVSYFTLNFTLSAVKGSIGDMNSPGLINFGKFDDLTYHLYEFVAFSIMGAMGGFLGAMFNHLNYLLSVLRIKYINRPFSKVIEAMLVASVTASFGFLMIYSIRDCRDIDTEKGGHPVQLFCKEGEESTSAVLLFSTPEECVRSLFHDPKGAYEWTT